VPADFDEKKNHQLTLWTHFLEHFGLNAPAELSPVQQPVASSNNPEKRWPLSHWIELIKQIPAGARIILFGTATDRAITDEISARVDRPVQNLAGQTKLPEYCNLLSNCSLLITNDTGGMHLANALGTPLIALFGPTNPIRTGPVFTGPTKILQPLDCPAEGRMSLHKLTPQQVFSHVEAMLTSEAD
jgi:ADP-heptose:LPS heptosyltransferase